MCRRPIEKGRSSLLIVDIIRFQILVNADVDVQVRDNSGMTPSMWACRMDCLHSLQTLLSASQNRANNSANNQHQNTVTSLTGKGGVGDEVDESGWGWVHWAIRRTEPLTCLTVNYQKLSQITV